MPLEQDKPSSPVKTPILSATSPLSPSLSKQFSKQHSGVEDVTGNLSQAAKTDQQKVRACVHTMMVTDDGLLLFLLLLLLLLICDSPPH